jgi:hypothetical protein
MTEPTADEFVFTFGAGQRLRSTSRDGTGAGGYGINLDGWFVAIQAEDRFEAREIMFALFGACWSFDYAPRSVAAADRPLTQVAMSARQLAGVDLYRMRELDVTEALADLERERASMSPVDGPLIGWADYLERVKHDDDARPAVQYLLWSNKHSMWWRPGAQGYTKDRDEAGRYSQAEALERVLRSSYHGTVSMVTCMVAVPS